MVPVTGFLICVDLKFVNSVVNSFKTVTSVVGGKLGGNDVFKLLLVVLGFGVLVTGGVDNFVPIPTWLVVELVMLVDGEVIVPCIVVNGSTELVSGIVREDVIV